MGKSPGKWIKTILFGKKASKSSLSKRREIPKSSYEKASSAPTEGLVSSVAVDPPFTSETAPVEIAGENKNLESGNVEVSRESNELSRSSSKQDGDAERATNNGDPYDLDRICLEQAATKAQATFRGYLARRAFRTLKGIIRLQAVIRGHLVRRQAVATLYCVHGIVKLQALVRGRMIRHSDIGGEVRGKQSLSRRETGDSDSRKANTYSQREKLLKNAFIRQLLSSSPTVMPLRLQYDPAEPNSAWNWLLRWTMSRVWGARCEPKKTTDLKEKVGPKKTIDLKQKVETKKVGQKHSGHKKQSANVENASSRPTSESEKLKHNPRKALNQSVKSVQEQPRSGTDKVKHNPKKASKFASEIPVQKDVGSEKPKSDLSKLSNPQVPEFSGDRSNNQSDKPIKDLEGIVSHSENEEKSAAVPHRDDTVNDLDGYPVSDVKHRQTSDKNETIIDVDRDLNSMEECIINENHKINRRRISLLAKRDDQETEQHGTRVPSYMSSTESAKAKVRGQVSPKLGQDVAEKDGLIRRHSLPSSINGKPSSSPRVQRLIQANGKGGLKIDRSLTSSRDSNDKVTQAEWRR